jgi:hypothetical protein
MLNNEIESLKRTYFLFFHTNFPTNNVKFMTTLDVNYS